MRTGCGKPILEDHRASSRCLQEDVIGLSDSPLLAGTLTPLVRDEWKLGLAPLIRGAYPQEQKRGRILRLGCSGPLDTWTVRAACNTEP